MQMKITFRYLNKLEIIYQPFGIKKAEREISSYGEVYLYYELRRDLLFLQRSALCRGAKNVRSENCVLSSNES